MGFGYQRTSSPSVAGACPVPQPQGASGGYGNAALACQVAPVSNALDSPLLAPGPSPAGPVCLPPTPVQQAQQMASQQRSVGLSVGGTLPAGRLSFSSDGNTFSNPEACHFQVGIRDGMVYADFSPNVHIRPADWRDRVATGGILLTRVEFNLQTGRVEPFFRLGGGRGPLTGTIEDRVRAQLSEAFTSAIPGSFRRSGYDPMTDPQLTSVLERLAGELSQGGGGGGGAATQNLAQMRDPFVRLDVVPQPAQIPLSGGRSLTIGDRATFQATAYLANGTATPSLERVEFAMSGMSIGEGNSVLARLDVRSLTLGADLSVRQLDYRLGLEDVLTGFQGLAMLAQLQTGRDLGVRSTDPVRVAAIRELVDAELRTQIPQLARDALRRSGASIPGLPTTP